MLEYITVTEKIERRTYLKGYLTAKFTGTLDQTKSDLKIENFYNIDILEAKIFAHRKDFRTWHHGGEHEEFIEAEIFSPILPNQIPCTVESADGKYNYYKIDIFESKLLNYRIFKQVYEKGQLFAVIEGEISGYLRHYDTEEKQIEVIKPKPIEKRDRLEMNFPAVGYIPSGLRNTIGNSRSTANQGCAPQFGCSVLPGGCLSLLAGIFIAYLVFAALIGITSALIRLFTVANPLVLPFLWSVIIPLFLIGTAIYIFFQLKFYLSPFWIWIFRLLIVLLVFFLCFG